MKARYYAAVGLLIALALTAWPRSGTAGTDEFGDGPFAMQLRVATSARLPVVGTQRSVTTSLLLVSWERDGTAGALTQRHRVCDVRMEGGSGGVAPRVPDAFVQSLPSRQYPAEFRPGQGGRYMADFGLEAIGFDPRLTNGQLPAAPGDAGVLDPDADGRPGATIELRIPVFGRARIYVVQRSHLLLRGSRTEAGRIAGDVEIRLLEQRALGADPALFNHTPAVEPDPARSGFVLVRVPEGTGCGRLRRDAGQLFANAVKP